MTTKNQQKSKTFIIFSICLLISSIAVGQSDKSYTPTNKRSTTNKNTTVVTKKPLKKKRSSVKPDYEFGPVKAITSFFDDSMFDFGAADITDTYTYDDDSMYEFGAAETPSDFYDDSSKEFGPAKRVNRHHDLTTTNFQAVKPSFFNLKDNFKKLIGGNKPENSEETPLAYSGKGATVKAGSIRKTPIMVSRFPSKEEIKLAHEKSLIGRTQAGYKFITGLILKPKEVKEVKEVNDSKVIVNPR